MSEREVTLADLLLGSGPFERSADEDKPALRPSAVRVVSVATTGTLSEGRVRVAIDRKRGAAVPRKLFLRALVRDAVVEVTLLVDHEQLKASLDLGMSQDPGEALLCLRAALAAWSPRLGGLKSAGLGDGRLGPQTRCADVDLNSAAALESLFRSESTTGYLDAVQHLAHPVAPPSWVRKPNVTASELACAFTLVDCLLIDAVRPPSGAERDARNNHAVGAEVIAGTAWRGVLRARCEFILRSLVIAVCQSSDVTCGRCPTCLLFGWSPVDSPQAGRGAFGAASLVRIGDSPLRRDKGKPLVRQVLRHVAIDRFSGGAADSKLFTTDVIVPPAKVSLHITAADPARPVPEWAWPLLWMAIPDIDYGLVGLGGATTRGCGTLRASKRPDQQLVGWPAAVEQLQRDFGVGAI
ncbi:MAG: RAMP superfamily CRISPR-associated protein [Candidatus Nanopelagicales bacterium]